MITLLCKVHVLVWLTTTLCILSCLFHLDTSLLTGPQAVVTDTLGPGDMLTISWPAPSNTNFLVAYSVSYSTSSRRHRTRETSLPVEVPAGTTNTTLPFTAFTNYTVNVDAIYAPPPDGNRVNIYLLPPTTFTTPQRRKKLVYMTLYMPKFQVCVCALSRNGRLCTPPKM